VASQRLRHQQLTARTLSSPASVVSTLVAVQAQDPVAARWAVGLRMAGGVVTESAVGRALAEGSILRTHVMRWTWQLVCPADVRWLLALVAPRLRQKYARRHRELGLDRAALEKSRAVLERALAGGEHLTRIELSERLARAKVPATGAALSHLLGHAELEGLICSGTPRGKIATYALLDLRVPTARRLPSREEALSELARRYFLSRGPASVADFAWWAGLTLTEAKAGHAGARPHLVSEVVEGKPLWRGGASAPAAGEEGPADVQLLPAFDEYLVAYRDRGAVLDARLARRINAGGGMLDPCVVVDGRVAGTWRRTLGRGSVDVELRLFERPPAAIRRALLAAVARYGAFLELEARVVGGLG